MRKTIPLEVTFSVDALSATMMLVVTGVGFLIHLYSTGYMAKDRGYHRFFAYLNLFIFSMLVLILGDNLAVLFVGWEGVGLCRKSIILPRVMPTSGVLFGCRSWMALKSSSAVR